MKKYKSFKELKESEAVNERYSSDQINQNEVFKFLDKLKENQRKVKNGW